MGAADNRPLRICSHEDRPEAMDSLILMGESLCRANVDVSPHLTVPEAPDSVRAWARRRRGAKCGFRGRRCRRFAQPPRLVTGRLPACGE
jgi:hypothetical protein